MKGHHQYQHFKAIQFQTTVSETLDFVMRSTHYDFLKARRSTGSNDQLHYFPSKIIHIVTAFSMSKLLRSSPNCNRIWGSELPFICISIFEVWVRVWACLNKFIRWCCICQQEIKLLFCHRWSFLCRCPYFQIWF